METTGNEGEMQGKCKENEGEIDRKSKGNERDTMGN